MILLEVDDTQVDEIAEAFASVYGYQETINQPVEITSENQGVLTEEVTNPESKVDFMVRKINEYKEEIIIAAKAKELDDVKAETLATFKSERAVLSKPLNLTNE